MYCGECGKKIDDKANFCPECGSEIEEDVAVDNSEQESGVTNEHDIEQLDKRLMRLEKLGINHPNAYSRAFAVWGHFVVAQLILSLALLFIALILLAVWN